MNNTFSYVFITLFHLASSDIPETDNHTVKFLRQIVKYEKIYYTKSKVLFQ